MIICSLVENKRAVVEHFYKKESPYFHSLTHKRGGTIEQNIRSTVDTISEYSEMFEVDMNGELAAFFVRYEDENAIILEGFHIGKEFRTKDFIPKFWEVVQKKMGSIFYTGIYERNGEAINHLIKQGFTLIKEMMDKDQKVFIFKSK